MTSPKITTSIAAVTVALAFTATGAAHASTHHGKAGKTTAKHHETATRKAGKRKAPKRHRTSAPATGGQDLASRYAVFARTQQDTDIAPAGVLALITRNALNGPVDATGSRRVGSDGVRAIYAVPTPHGLCAALVVPQDQTSAVACTDHAHEGFTSAFSATSAGITIWGVAADEIHAVTATFPGGKAVTIPVHDNGYIADFPDAPKSITAG